MKKLNLVPYDTKIPFLKYANISCTISGAAVVISLILWLTVGLNLGIDFRGGTLLEIRTDQQTGIASLRAEIATLNLGDVQIQEFGAENDILIRVEQQKGGEQAQQNALEKIKQKLKGKVEFRRQEVVGPAISAELAKDGIIAIVSAITAVLIYIWLRFEWQFSIGAILALIHDVIVTIGLFSILQLEFSLSIIAALLTIVGYSLNDTVVVYDRVRENLRKYKTRSLQELLDIAINNTLSRTILTSVTTLIALIALYAFGGAVIRGFTFAMIWGVIVGTYSSVFIAAPLLLYTGVKRDWTKAGQGKTADKYADVQ